MGVGGGWWPCFEGKGWAGGLRGGCAVCGDGVTAWGRFFDAADGGVGVGG